MSDAPVMTRLHHRRLREIYRSAGWPCHDMLEVELLAAGQLERVRSPDGHETLRVTDAGIQTLAPGFTYVIKEPHGAIGISCFKLYIIVVFSTINCSGPPYIRA